MRGPPGHALCTSTTRAPSTFPPPEKKRLEQMPCQPKSFRRSSSHHYGAAAHCTCGWRPFLVGYCRPWAIPRSAIRQGDINYLIMLEFLKTNPAFALLKKDHGRSTSGGGCDGGRQPR